MASHAITLAQTVAPLSEAEFLSLLRRRQFALVRTADPARFRGLLNWNVLADLIGRGEHPRGLADFRVTRESKSVPAHRYLVRDGERARIDVEKLEGLLAEGFSLCVTPIQPYVPTLAALCAKISEELSEEIKIGVIVTQGPCGAFKLHYDPEDLLILQVEGTKRWQMFGPAVANPIIGMPKPLPPAEDSPFFDEVLEPGDILFLPAGTWHHCQNGPGRSLHLGIFFIPPTPLHAIKAMASEFVSNELFRIPLTRLEDASAMAALEENVKARLTETIKQLDLTSFAAGWKLRNGKPQAS